MPTSANYASRREVTYFVILSTTFRVLWFNFSRTKFNRFQRFLFHIFACTAKSASRERGSTRTAPLVNNDRKDSRVVYLLVFFGSRGHDTHRTLNRPSAYYFGSFLHANAAAMQ